MSDTADLKIQRRFEHKIEIVHASGGLDAVSQRLDAMGDDGWECFHVQSDKTQHADWTAVALFFRRPATA